MSEAIPNKRKRYNPLRDNQKDILIKYFDAGMTGTKESFSSLIEKAADEASISKEKVSQWIGNEKQKRRLQARDSADFPEQSTSKAKLPSFIKGASSYNRFAGEVFKTDECKDLPLAERNRLVSHKWRSLSEEEKRKFKKESPGKEINISNLNEEQKEKLIKTYRKQLESVVGFLEDVGCTSSILLLEPNGHLSGLGSSEGQKFFSSNPDVVLKFRQHFSVKCDNKTYDFKDVQTLFNAKYSEAVGKPSQVPYLRGGFEVQGLPDRIPFRSPTAYGNKQLKEIMESKDSIKFVIQSVADDVEDNVHTQPGTQPEKQDHQTAGIIKLLKKIVDSEIAKQAVYQHILITEEKIELLNVSLSQEERLLLLGKARPFFDLDAWVTLGGTLKHEMATQHDNGAVVPIFNDADEPYWLFYVPGQISSLCKVTPNKTVNGYWLDKTTEGYALLHNNFTSIKGKNIIKSDNGIILYLQTELEIKKDVTFQVPSNYHDTIMDIMKRLDITF